ncbi:MAG: hypothetical protein PHE18_02865 [Candidatus Omnitrophica bacterium]|nr:hypothetical protein [Candidatus Omnitrophota bacterium]
MQKKFKVLILIVVIIFAFFLVRDFLIKSVIGTAASNITGAPTRVGGLSLSIIKQSIKITNLRMYNPKGFPRDILVDIPKINVAWDLGAFFKGKLHLTAVDLEIKEVSMTKNKEGKLNVDSLKIAEEKPGEKEKKPAKQLPMQMDLVSLGMGKVVSRDYSVQGPPVVKVYDINLKKTYKNITSAQQLAILIISEPLKAAGIQGLKVYGVSMLTGVAALPVMAAFTFTGKDYAQQTFNVSADKAYEAGLQTLKAAGKVKREDKVSGSISAAVSGAGVNFKINKLSGNSTEVTISARKFGLPKPAIAAGVMYRLNEELD